MLEASIEEWVVDKAESAGWLCRKAKWQGRRRAPDRFFAKGGRVVLIEFKRPGESLKADQHIEIGELRNAGVEVHVCDNPLAALRVLGVDYA